ncbi:hypothetical protein ACS0TY_030532 [Phlomoides rotata]
MDQVAFRRLCYLLKNIGGLRSSRNVTVAEKVAMFLCILAHHTKNRCVKYQFKRSGQTVSKHFHAVLECVLKLHHLFLVKPLPVLEDIVWIRGGESLRCMITRQKGGKLEPLNLEIEATARRNKGQNRREQLRRRQVGIEEMAEDNLVDLEIDRTLEGHGNEEIEQGDQGRGGGSSYNPNARKHENFSYSNPKAVVQFPPGFDPGAKISTHEGKASNEDALALILNKMEGVEAQVTQMNQQQKAMEFQIGQLATTIGYMQNKERVFGLVIFLSSIEDGDQSDGVLRCLEKMC